MAPRIRIGYVLAAAGYMAGIFLVSSSMAEPGLAAETGAVQSPFWNLLHVPLFAGFSLSLLLSVSEGEWSRTLPWPLYGVIGLIAGAYAAFDEWHRSFVGGRYASLGDFLLNCAGIVGLLGLHWLAGRPEGRS